MPTILENLSQIRALLDDPTPQHPSDRILFELLNNAVFHHQNQLQNTQAAWSVANWPLTVAAGVEDYLVTATDFGKPFIVYTEDTNDPTLPRVEIPFALLQNMDQFYAGPRQVNASGSNVFTTSVVSFYRSGESYYVRVAPVPGGSATYRVWYEVAPQGASALSSTPGLTPFHHLIRTQAALAALPYCSWGDVKSDAMEPRAAAAWERKTKALAMALTTQAAQFQREFDTYKATLMQAGVERRKGFADDYLDEWGYGVGSLGPNAWGR